MIKKQTKQKIGVEESFTCGYCGYRQRLKILAREIKCERCHKTLYTNYGE